jgi:hypothetical protein
MVLTQAFCPDGHNLTQECDVSFDGHCGIKILAADDQGEDILVCSPVHGDPRKTTAKTISPGTKLRLMCPECRQEFPSLLPCTCGQGELVAIYLTPDRKESQVVAVCNAWGCRRSRIIDRWQIISQFVECGGPQ